MSDRLPRLPKSLAAHQSIQGQPRWDQQCYCFTINCFNSCFWLDWTCLYNIYTYFMLYLYVFIYYMILFCMSYIIIYTRFFMYVPQKTPYFPLLPSAPLFFSKYLYGVTLSLHHSNTTKLEMTLPFDWLPNVLQFNCVWLSTGSWWWKHQLIRIFNCSEVIFNLRTWRTF